MNLQPLRRPRLPSRATLAALRPRLLPLPLLAACALALPLSSRPAAAQTLVNGGSVSGVLSPAGDVDTYTFDASAGQGVQIQTADIGQTSLVPYVRVFSPTGVLLHTGSGASVAALYFTAQVSGTFTLEVSDWNSTGTGSYEVHYAKAPGANEHGALVNGGQVAQSIGLGDLDSFTFVASAGEGLQIQMVDLGSTNLVPYMRVYGPTGAFLHHDSDGSVASIFFTAQTTGTYTLVASDWNATGIGDYEIHYTRAPGANEHGALINGGFVSQTIGLGDLDSYTFVASAGEGVQLQMADLGSTNLVPYMRVYGPTGAFLHHDSDGSVASILFTAQTTGTYTLVASDWNATGIGDYEIHFTRAPGANEHGALINGGFVSQTIGLGDLDSYTFVASAGEGLQLQMADLGSTNLVPYMRVYGPTGAFLHHDSDGSVASILFTAQTTGTYTLVASDWNATGIGDYEVHFTHRPGANEGGALINGGSVSDMIDLGDLDSFTFDAQAGEGVQLQMVDLGSTNLVPYMRVYGPTGAFLHHDSDGSVASILFTAQTTGTYTLVASDWNATGIGDYAIHFTRAPGANEHGKLVHGATPSGTIELGDLDSFTIDAYVGEDIELEMTDVNGTSLTPYMRLYGPNGAYLTHGSGSSVATIAYTAQTTGTYTLVASDWNATGVGDYGLTLARGVTTYCTAGTTASGCSALMSAYGDPSASAPNGFLVRATGGEGNQVGVYFFGSSGQIALPWGTSSSFLCVAPPIQRTPAAHGGGTTGACNAAAVLDFNELITLNPPIAPAAGSVVQIQYWFRDPLNPSGQGSSMSDALEFTLHP